MSTSTNITIAVGLLALIFTASLWLLGADRDAVDAREPPLARSRIPWIGHVVNLLRHHNRYFSILRNTQPHPITTLKIFSQRIYIISSPTLAQAAFRASKTIDFETLKKTASCNVANLDQRSCDIVWALPDPERGNSNYMLELHNEMYGALMGHPLLETNARILNCLAQTLNGVGTVWEDKKLLAWLRIFYSTASAEALYGKENPIAWDEKLVPLIWDFEKQLGLLFLNFFPSITARKGHSARIAIAPPFEKYYQAGLSQHASGLVQARERCARKWGMTTQEIAKAEISILFAAITNTVPNAFFLLCYVFSDATLVATLRDEVSGIVRQEGSNVVLGIGKLRERCPLLSACVQETLRLVKTGASVRIVLEDTMLGDEYLLKKGGIVQIPTGVLQSDPHIWGPDAEEFQPRRWLNADPKTLSKGEREARKAHGQAYLPFGGGKNMCPGRNLAFNEIAAFVAMVLWGFEIRGGDGTALKAQRGGMCNLGDGSTNPKGDLDVKIRRRPEFEGCVFGCDVGGMEDGS